MQQVISTTNCCKNGGKKMSKTNNKKSKKKDWIIFIISISACVGWLILSIPTKDPATIQELLLNIIIILVGIIISCWTLWFYDTHLCEYSLSDYMQSAEDCNTITNDHEPLQASINDKIYVNDDIEDVTGNKIIKISCIVIFVISIVNIALVGGNVMDIIYTQTDTAKINQEFIKDLGYLLFSMITLLFSNWLYSRWFNESIISFISKKIWKQQKE